MVDNYFLSKYPPANLPPDVAARHRFNELKGKNKKNLRGTHSESTSESTSENVEEDVVELKLRQHREEIEGMFLHVLQRQAEVIQWQSKEIDDLLLRGDGGNVDDKEKDNKDNQNGDNQYMKTELLLDSDTGHYYTYDPLTKETKWVELTNQERSAEVSTQFAQENPLRSISNKRQSSRENPLRSISNKRQSKRATFVGWTKFLHEESGRNYYENDTTGESRWE
jgi:hypothetical protein